MKDFKEPTARSEVPIRLSRRTQWLYIFAFWTFLGLFFAVQMVISYASRGTEPNWTSAIVFQMSRWYAWGLLTPVVLTLARRYSFTDMPGRALAVHFASGILTAPLQVILALILQYGTFLAIGTVTSSQVADFLPNLPVMVLTGSFDSFIVYWIILGVFTGWDYFEKHRERQLYASRLEAQLSRAQLNALKMQLHPHFLFNTLHGITALIPTDPVAAETMIARLSDLLRLTFENEGTQQVSLKDELDFLTHYLDIEKTRFQDRLEISMEIDEDTLQGKVPNLILQPLVENAIRHGVAALPGVGRISIRSTRHNGKLSIVVADNGPGVETGADILEGVGLSNTRRRLHQLYQDDFMLRLTNEAGRGFEVRLEIPFEHITMK